MNPRVSLLTGYQPPMPAAPKPQENASEKPSAMKRAWQAVKGVFVKQEPEKQPLAAQSNLSDYGTIRKQ